MSDSSNFDPEKVLEDGVVTGCVVRHLSEALEREDHEERVLNGPLTSVCTYPEDYKERQSLYSCLTCQEKTGEFAGVCFACSEHCHEDHDLVQLYTKRNFCCDCGNSKFKGQECKLYKEKIDVNRKNKYNHNFKNEYCTCNLPYPPPEDHPLHEVDMIQCVMCEDWFHAQHIGLEDVNSDDYTELICPSCFQDYQFIIPYHYVCEQEEKQNASNEDKDETRNLDVGLDETTGTVQGNEKNEANEKNESNLANLSSSPTTISTEPSSTSNDYYPARKPSSANNSSNDEQKDCYYEKIKAVTPDLTTPRALIFHNIDWRPMLCRCEKCKRIYEDKECEFLLDEKDSVYHYLTQNAKELEKNKKPPETELLEEITLRSNATVGHAVVAEIASFKRKLHEFFDDKSKGDKVITSEDIQSFFSDLEAKRRRLDEPPSDDH